MIPMKLEQTFENPSITDPEERNRLFGHPDHVRRYGRDFIERVRRAGFSCRQLSINDLVDSDEVDLMGLWNDKNRGGLYGNAMFHCTKSI